MKYLTYEHALSLVEILKKHAPIDTAALKHSITISQQISNGFVVLVGSEGSFGTDNEPSTYALWTNIDTKGYSHTSGWIQRACHEWRDKTQMEINHLTQTNMNGDGF